MNQTWPCKHQHHHNHCQHTEAWTHTWCCRGVFHEPHLQNTFKYSSHQGMSTVEHLHGLRQRPYIERVGLGGGRKERWGIFEGVGHLQRRYLTDFWDQCKDLGSEINLSSLHIQDKFLYLWPHPPVDCLVFRSLPQNFWLHVVCVSKFGCGPCKLNSDLSFPLFPSSFNQCFTYWIPLFKISMVCNSFTEPHWECRSKHTFWNEIGYEVASGYQILPWFKGLYTLYDCI